MGELRSFHGLASFYRKLINNFSVAFNVMNETMRGDKKEFKWTHGAGNAIGAILCQEG